MNNNKQFIVSKVYSAILFNVFVVSIISSSVSCVKWSGPLMHILIICSTVSSPILILNLVLINFILLNDRSTVAVVTRNTSGISANLNKLGNPALMSSFPFKSTSCKDF